MKGTSGTDGNGVGSLEGEFNGDGDDDPTGIVPESMGVVVPGSSDRQADSKRDKKNNT
jgi:hypothetical protein